MEAPVTFTRAGGGSHAPAGDGSRQGFADRPGCVGAGPGSVRDLRADVHDLRALAVRSLPRMYRPQQRVFAFRLRRVDGCDRLEGVSRRYTAIVLIALAGESPGVAAEVLHGHRVEGILDGLARDCETSAELGEVALSLWAARLHCDPAAGSLLRRLQAMQPDAAPWPTVELAWSLSSLVAAGLPGADAPLAEALARRLLRSFRPASALFPHGPADAPAPLLRGHVACFADQVYPIQALSLYHRVTGCEQAASAARAAAARICALQGAPGQWWWHYDVRTGRVLERYPVYAIHQDAMGPMALFDFAECCGPLHMDAVARSMAWLFAVPELAGGSLVDRGADVVWRKVARREPGKLVRRLQAGLSALHPLLRVPAVDALFPPGRIDAETRPYHMGWLLHAWSPKRLATLWPADA